MEAFGGSEFGGANVGKKRRSIPSRVRRSDYQILLEGTKCLPHLSAQLSENASKTYLESGLGDDPSLNNFSQRTVSINKINGTGLSKKKKGEGRSGDVGGFYRNDSRRVGHPGNNEPRRNGSDLRRCSEGVLAPANWKSTTNTRENLELPLAAPDGSISKNGDGYSLDHSVGGSSGSGENKPKKLKFKVGGLPGTIHAKSNTENTFSKSSHPLNASWHRQKHMLQDNSDDSQFHTEQGNCMQGRDWRDFGEHRSHGAEEDTRGKAVGKSSSTTQIDKVHSMNSSVPTRKSKRVPKKRAVEDTFDDSDEDDEIRYLERLKTSKIVKGDADDYGHEGNKLKKRKVSEASKNKVSSYDFDEEYVSQSIKDGERQRKTAKKSIDIAYVDEDEPGTDASLDLKEKKREGSADTVGDGRVGALTTRQRALQSSKDGGTGDSLIEFPNGLPPAPRRKQKEKLSEVELQAKKAEAAQRRRMQVEKTNRELEAAVINKILGKDPNKKKKEEEKLKEMQANAEFMIIHYAILMSVPTNLLVIGFRRKLLVCCHWLLAQLDGPWDQLELLLHLQMMLACQIYLNPNHAVILCHEKNVLVLHVPMLTSTEIPKQIFPSVAYSVIELSKRFLRQEHHVDSPVQHGQTYCPLLIIEQNSLRL